MSIVVEKPRRDEAEVASGDGAAGSRSLAVRLLVPVGAFLASNLVLWAALWLAHDMALLFYARVLI
jgi:hypothetical protein